MATTWQLMRDKYDELSLRERGLVLLSILAGLYVIWSVALGGPTADAQRRVDEQINQLSQQVSSMIVEEATYIQAAAGDPDRSLRLQRDQLQAQRQSLDEQLAELSLGLVPVQQLASVLQEVLARATQLQLRSLQTLPVETLNLTATTAGADSVGVYKHSVVIAVRGSYFEVLEYLRTLESLDWRFYWEELRYEQEQYPNGLFELRVFTLSTDEGLLGV